MGGANGGEKLKERKTDEIKKKIKLKILKKIE